MDVRDELRLERIVGSFEVRQCVGFSVSVSVPDCARLGGEMLGKEAEGKSVLRDEAQLRSFGMLPLDLVGKDLVLHIEEFFVGWHRKWG